MEKKLAYMHKTCYKQYATGRHFIVKILAILQSI
jgi:hypothetical protein